MAETPEERAARIAEWEREPSQKEIEQAIAAARRPALLLNLTKYPKDAGEPGCWMLGRPTLPPEIDWPHHCVVGRQVPLHFLMQVNLARLPRQAGLPRFPESGTLFFFYDPAFITSAAKVIFCEDDVSGVPRPKPEMPKDQDFWEHPHLDFLDDEYGALSDSEDRQWNFDFLTIDRFEEKARNRIIDYEIIKANTGVVNGVSELTKGRWSTCESGSLQGMQFHYLFGCQTNADAPAGDPMLLFALGGAIVYNFWLPKDALSMGYFDKVLVTMSF